MLKQIDYEICKNCNYYYGEIDVCMCGEEDVPNNLGKICEGEPKLIKSWEELSKIPNESETHILKIDLNMRCGWLYCKSPVDYDANKDFDNQITHLTHYLSTHTFYSVCCESSTHILQKCGFYVTIDNCEKV